MVPNSSVDGFVLSWIQYTALYFPRISSIDRANQIIKTIIEYLYGYLSLGMNMSLRDQESLTWRRPMLLTNGSNGDYTMFEEGN